MKIDTLQLVNFRNYDQASLRFPRMVNVFYGKNGQGKTNLLEAIFYAAFGLSHRSNREEDLVRFGQDGLAVLASLEREDGPHRIRCKRCVENGRWRKEVRIDDKRRRRGTITGSSTLSCFPRKTCRSSRGNRPCGAVSSTWKSPRRIPCTTTCSSSTTAV